MGGRGTSRTEPRYHRIQVPWQDREAWTCVREATPVISGHSPTHSPQPAAEPVPPPRPQTQALQPTSAAPRERGMRSTQFPLTPQCLPGVAVWSGDLSPALLFCRGPVVSPLL